MNNSNSLSVIIVTRNRAKLLAVNLSSLVGQSRGEDEIVVVDNGSTDETSHVLALFRKKLPMRIIRSRGTYPTLYNAGARHAKGDILVFLDDDCRVDRLFLSLIRKAHRKYPGAVIQGMSYSIPKGNVYAEIMGDHYRNWLATLQISDNELRTFDNKNASIPRSLFWKYHGFSSQMSRGSEDIELGMRLRRHGIPIFLNRSIICYHYERTTLTGFFSQHRRFADSEGYLDSILPSSERLGVISGKKLSLHARSALTREVRYLKDGNIRQAILLPFLYLALAWIRFWGYATNR